MNLIFQMYNVTRYPGYTGYFYCTIHTHLCTHTSMYFKSPTPSPTRHNNSPAEYYVRDMTGKNAKFCMWYCCKQAHAPAQRWSYVRASTYLENVDTTCFFAAAAGCCNTKNSNNYLYFHYDIPTTRCIHILRKQRIKHGRSACSTELYVWSIYM